MAKTKAPSKKRKSSSECILYTYGRYSVVKEEGGYYVRNDETNVNEEATNKLFEAIRLAKAFEKHLEAAIEWEPKDWNVVKQPEHVGDEEELDAESDSRLIN